MENDFKLKDLHLSAYIYAKGQNLRSIERINGVCWFVFADKSSCLKLSDDFWSGKAFCNVTDYVNALRTLKDRIYSEK